MGDGRSVYHYTTANLSWLGARRRLLGSLDLGKGLLVEASTGPWHSSPSSELREGKSRTGMIVQ
jgi:hypothetical protein